MKRKTPLVRIGIVGCGAIGSRMAKSIVRDLKNHCRLTGLYDIDVPKARHLSRQLRVNDVVKDSLNDLISSCTFVIEAVNAFETKNIIQKILRAKRNILVMSVGRILNAPDIFTLAEKNRCSLLIPSGALSGLDAIKAASQVNISRMTLTTRKPPSGFSPSDYLKSKGIDLKNIASEIVIYDGNVDRAVKLFPQNINVAATLALAAGNKNKIRIRIITSPKFKTNSHEVEIHGDFGTIISRTDNVVCPDNAKTSYLAVLSAIRTLKQHFQLIKIGT